MASDPEKGPSAKDESASEELVTPPTTRPIIEDTARQPFGPEPRTASQAMSAHIQATSHMGVAIEERHQITISPFPDSKTLRELARIYPDAAKIIFESHQAQSAHRLEIESSVIRTKNTLALRGQLIGGAVAVIGLVGSLIIAGQGHEIGGIGIALTSTTGLVSIFVLGRESQKKELASKANIRDRIKGGEPIENFEGDLAPVTPKPKPPA